MNHLSVNFIIEKFTISVKSVLSMIQYVNNKSVFLIILIKTEMRISMNNKQFCLLHQFLNKAVSLLIVFIIVITLSGCSLPWNQKQISETTISATEDNADFTEYVNNLFADLLSADMVSLHAYVEHPRDFGINDYEITLGRYDLDNPDDTSDYTDIISTLKSFDRSTLSAKQQITLDELLMYIENELEYSDLYMFNTQLQTTTGIHVQLPLLFAEYTFAEKKDIDEYIELLCDVDGYFENMSAFEKLRADNGYFMEDTLADEVIESCNSFLETAGSENGALISTFNEKLASVDGLSSQDIADYKAKNVSAVNEHVIPGYQSLVNALTSLKGSNRYSGGLCNYPDGSRYFEYILSSTLGWSKSVDEYDKLVDSYLKKYMLKMQSLALKDSSILDKFDTFSFNMTDPVGILTDLKKRITDDFPEIPDVNYNIKYVSKALEDYTSPAMYFIPQLDNLDINSIYINSSGTSASELYPTLAHEGYPGHMYQTQYFAATNPDWIRYILAPGGYVEGWASYVEVLSYNYAQTGNDALNKMYAANYATVLCLYAKGDIGVNYYGWSEDDVYRFISQYGFDDKSVAHEMYYAFVSDPGNYCKYVLGMLGFEQLKTKAQSELSDKFNLKNFHQYILDMGPVQFDILFNNLDAWIKKEK